MKLLSEEKIVLQKILASVLFPLNFCCLGFGKTRVDCCCEVLLLGHVVVVVDVEMSRDLSDGKVTGKRKDH